ncbi:hypothetical protein ES332_D13G068100v1 [Gossypium tomentosum]|uniref:Uncharacterized protein n=1 Tax=Gossypium tomentosum TaxID=34277 RepID=A0A5D2HU07_GOSTO|nr:hypothetical protein ES332_D13G068100v1 [Gossypium tomentosum]
MDVTSFFIQLLMFVFCCLNVLVGIGGAIFFSYLSSSYTKLMLCCVITKIRLEYMWQNDLINELALNCKKRKQKERGTWK